MSFLKKEWKAIILIICLVVIAVYLSQIRSQLEALNIQSAKMVATIDSIESVSLSTDAVVHDMGKKIDGIDANVSYVVQKVRRR